MLEPITPIIALALVAALASLILGTWATTEE